MKIHVFDSVIEVFQFDGEYPAQGTSIIFKQKRRNLMEAGYVYHYKTRCPKICVHGSRSYFVEFSDLDWWGKME